MNAKLVSFSEITKLGSVKNRLCEDIFSLFGLFRLSQTIKRLGVEKQCGHSASEVIQALCMFKILGETVSSMYSVKFHELICIGKNCFYRMLSRSQMDWRRLLATMTVHLLGIFRRRGVDFYAGTSCFILDDTTMAKTTTNGELVSRVFDHVLSKCVLGYKVQLLCVSDGTTTIPFDFSIHREKGRKGDYGLTKAERKAQFHKERTDGMPSSERVREADMNKMDVAIDMIRRAWKKHIRPQYVLADSWYLCARMMAATLEIGEGALHYLGMGKMDGTTYKVHGKRHNAADLIALYEREFSHDSRKYHCHYIVLNGEYAKSGIKVRIFLIKYGRNRSWNILVTTDTTMSFTKAFETYQMRWAIEVLIKDCRQNLGFGKCQSNDFDSQLADVTITLMTYQIAALDLRFSQYETMGQLFRGMSAELNKLTLWNTMLECLERILAAIAEACGWDMDSALRSIATSEETTREMLFLASALKQYRAGADCIMVENVKSY